MLLAVIFVAAYLIGSVPVGFLVAKSKGVDILHFGSGNIGATNVHRALGKWLGLLVFALDVSKGLLPALVTTLWMHDQLLSFGVGLAAVLGHCLSPFLKFKGGKGIATGLGALLGSAPIVAGVALGAFLIVMVISRYVSLSSIVAAATLVPTGLVLHVKPVMLGLFVGLFLFIVFKHRKNIARLTNGTEPKFVFDKSKPETPSLSATGMIVFVVGLGMIGAVVSAVLQSRA